MTFRRDPVFDEYLNQTYAPVHVPVLNRATPSADLLANIDPDLYNQRLDEWLDDSMDLALGRDTLPEPQVQSNRQRFRWLAELIARRRVIPFVGAGASASCGVPTWTQYLERVATESAYPLAALREYLADGRYEDAAASLVRRIGEAALRESFDRTFAHLPLPPVGTLPLAIASTFDGPLITTNYDQLLERAASPSQTFLGSSPGEFQRAAREGGRVLLKIHGDLYQPGARVLTRREYDRAYGHQDGTAWTRALPRALRWVFLRDTVCFVGASLSNDRTMRLLHELSRDRVEGSSMRHFAIVELPAGRPAVIRARDRFLASCSVFPLWYPADEHFRVTDILRHLSRVAKELR